MRDNKTPDMSSSIAAQVSSAIICREADEAIGSHTMAEVVAENLKKIGIKVPTDQKEIATLVKTSRFRATPKPNAHWETTQQH